MVKKVVLLTFLFGIFILCNILFESAKLVKIEKIELDYENINLGYMNSKRTLDLHDIYNNKLYLSVLDFNKENLGITKSILIYDLSLKNYKKIDLDFERRISDYIVENNKIYYVIIFYEEGKLKWEFYVNDLALSSKKLLKKGIFNNSLEYPILIRNDSNILLISTDDETKQQKVSIVENDLVNDIMVIDNNIERIFDVEKVLFKNNNIYFISMENKLRMYNSITKSFSTIYQANGKEELFDFKFLKDNIVLNVNINNQSVIKFIKINKKEIKEKKLKNVVTYMQNLNDNEILMIDINRKLILFNNSFKRKEVKSYLTEDILYKFLCYNENKLIFQSHNTDVINLYSIN